MNASMSTPRAKAFASTLAEYIRLRSTVDPADLIQRKAKSVAIELYRAAKAVAPTRAEITADVQTHGWAVKRPKGAWPLKKGEKRGSRGPLRRMQTAAVKRRARAIGFAASGFIPALSGLGAKATARDASNFPNPQGSLTQAGLGTTRPTIVVTNGRPGIVRVQQKHDITGTAFEAVTKDTQEYITRKTQETASKAKR